MSALECAGALIFDSQGRLFVQRRSPDRSLFPNCWDIVGGHVEPGESPEQTLRREVTEETGWRVQTVHGVLEPIPWTGDDGKARLEYDFLVSVDGDPQNPALEVGKHTEWRWITAAETPLLNQERRYGDSLILELVQLGFDKAQELGLSPSYASIIAPMIDRVFRETMLAAREMSRKLPTPGPLIDYRLVLPSRPLTPSDRDAVNRYSDPAGLHQGFLDQQELGRVTVADDGTVSLTERGRAFYDDLWALHSKIAGERLPPMPLLDKVLAACDEGPAFSAVHPSYLPEGATDALRTFVHLAALRYHRADAHAAAWAAAGLTAAQMVALPPGELRESIEAETNRLAGEPYRALTIAERFDLLAGLHAFGG